MRARESCCSRMTEVSAWSNEVITEKIKQERLRLYGQANKRIRRMPRRQEAMKDVSVCDKLRGADNQALIRRCPNGETRRTLKAL